MCVFTEMRLHLAPSSLSVRVVELLCDSVMAWEGEEEWGGG